MEIITQNYEKILENLIINNFSEIIKESKSKLPSDNQVFNYISILDTLDNKICDIHRRINVSGFFVFRTIVSEILQFLLRM